MGLFPAFGIPGSALSLASERKLRNNQIFSRMVWIFIFAFLIASTGAQRGPRYKTAYACEGSQLKLSCDEGMKINLIRANFGRFSISICNTQGVLEWAVNCQSRRSFRVMQEVCASRRNCILPASSGYFGDPCPGTYKYLEAHYECLSETGRMGIESRRPKDPRRQPSSVSEISFDRTPVVKQHHSTTLPPMEISSPSPTDDFTSKAVIIAPTSTASPSMVSDQNQESSDRSHHSAKERNNHLPALRSSVPSPTVATIIAEEKEVDVKHLHPMRPKSGEMERSEENDSRTSSHARDNGAFEKSSPKDISAVSVSPHLQHFNHSTSLLHDHCPPTYSGGIYWNWTRANEMAFLPCPSGATGRVRWYCARTPESPEWMPSLRPDFSNCSSLWVTNIVERINKRESFVNLARELAEITGAEDKSSRNLFGGDLFRAADIINQLVIRMEEAFELFSEDRQKNQLATELLQSIEDATSNMLDDHNMEPWFELPAFERKGAASSLMYALERNVLLLAETKNVHSDYVRAHNNIYVAIHVRETDAIRQEASAYSHRQGLELPIMRDSEMREGAIEFERNSDPSFPSNSVFLLPQTLVEYSRGGFTKVVVLMFKKLDKLLQPDDSVASYILARPTSDPSTMRTIINSDIVTVLMGRDRFSSMTLEGPGILINFKHNQPTGGNLTNARCVYWDGNQRDWETRGCSIKKTDATHSICECSHLSSFALLVDVLDRDQFEAIHHDRSHAFSFLDAIITSGSALAALCFALTLVSLVLSVPKTAETKHVVRVELEVKKNLTLCLLVVELIFLLGVNQTESKLFCGVIAAFLHYFFLALFLWLLFDGFTLYLALVADQDGEGQHHSQRQSHPSVYPQMYVQRKPSRWYYVLSYGVPMVILIISALIDHTSYGTAYHCWLRSDNYFVLSFVGPMIAILSANFLFLVITVCIICRNCLSSVFPKTSNDDLYHHRDTLSSTTSHAGDKFLRYNRMKNRLRESALLLLVVSLTWSLGVIYLNQARDVSLGRGDEAFARNASYIFAILNPLQGLVVLTMFCFMRDAVREKYVQILKRATWLNHCLHRSVGGSGASSQSDVSSKVSGGDCGQEPRKKLAHPEPMIPPPIANFSMSSQDVAALAARYYLTDGRTTDYGFRAQSANPPAFHPQLHQCNQLYLPSSPPSSGNGLCPGQAHQHKDCAQCQFPQIIEHVYECIDEDPYVAQLLMPNPLPTQLTRLQSLQGEVNAAFPATHCIAALPAIIRDNTMHSTIICSSAVPRPTVGVASGARVGHLMAPHPPHAVGQQAPPLPHSQMTPAEQVHIQQRHESTLI